MPLAIAIIAGIVVGLLVGGLGGGGAILAVPVFVYALHQSVSQATSGALIVVGLSALVGLIPHLKAGNVRLVQGLIFGLVGIGGSYLGSKASKSVDPNVLMTAFAVLLVVVASLMVRKALKATKKDDAEAIEASNNRSVGMHVKVALTATAVGLLTGFFGVGGGFAVVPALTLALGFTMPVAVGTSLVVIAVNSASAYVFHNTSGVSLNWGLVAPFAIAAVIGALVGGNVMQRIPKKKLSLSFAAFLYVVAIYTFIEATTAT